MSVADASFETAWGIVKDEPIHIVGSNELAQRARAGDEEAYEEMVNRLDDYYNEAEKIHGLTYEDVMSHFQSCLLYTSPSPRDQRGSRMPSSA